MGASFSHADFSALHSSTGEKIAEKVVKQLAASAAETVETSTQNDKAFTPPVQKEEPMASFSSSISSPQPKKPGFWWWGFDRSELPNPGGFDEISQDCAMIVRQNLIEGLNFNMSVPATPNVALGQSFELGAKDRPGVFAVTANYFSNSVVCMSRLTPSDGRVSGRIFVNHTPAITSKINGDIGFDLSSWKGSWDLDYRGSDFCSQLKFANGGIFAVSYMQSVAPWLALGGEGFYQSKSCFSAVTAAAKYSSGMDTATLSVASFGPVIATYVHRLNPRVAFASEIFVDGRTRDSHVSIGYKFDLRTASITGLVDSAGRVSATVEEKINPGLSLVLSGELDHQREDYKFGFGVNIGGN